MKVKNSIKKVGAVAGSALMVGLTMGSAATLSDYPQPFVDGDGNVASQIVVGSSGKVADVVGAVELAASVGQSAVQTETRTVSASGSAGWNAANGETLSTPNTNLFFQDSFTKSGLLTTMTSDDLGMLESGVVENVDNSDYSYDQYIEVGSHSTSIGNGGELDDDTLLVDFGESPDGSQLYTSRVTFDQGLHVGDAADDSAEIELFGTTYSFSTESNLTDDNQVVLFGGQESASVGEAESTTVTVDGTDIELFVDSVTGPNGANVEIDGDLRDGVSEDDTFSVAGLDEEVRIESIVFRGDLDYGERGRVVFSIGSEKLTLQDGSPVMVGSDENDVEGTYVTINGGSPTSAELSKLEVGVAGPDDENDFLQSGEEFEDPVFGTFSFAFGGLSPSEEADSRSEVTAGISGDEFGTLTMTDDNGNSATVNVATDSAPASSGTTMSLYSDDYDWNFVEGADMTEDTYFAVDSGDFTHLLNVRDIEGHDEGDEITFRDVFTGTEYTATLDSDTAGSDEIYIDGQQYHVESSDGSGVSVTWGGASAGDVGTATTVFPVVEDANGAHVAVADETSLSGYTLLEAGGSDHTFNLPTGELVVTTDASGNIDFEDGDGNSLGTNSDGAGTETTGTFKIGQLSYTVDYTETTTGTPADGSIDAIGISDNIDAATSLQSGTTAAEPEVVVVEEEDDGSTQNAFVLGYGDDSSSINVDAPEYTDTSKWDDSGTLDNDNSIYLTEYGTYAVEDDDSESVTLHYPDNQATVGAGFVEDGGELTTAGGGESVEYEAVTGTGSLPNLGLLDEDVTESVRSNNHLVLVGGPAVNSLVDTLNDDEAVDLSDVADAESGAVLQVVNDAFTSGQHALVVAGYGAQDTLSASRYLANYADHEQALSDAGERLVLTEADYPSSQ